MRGSSESAGGPLTRKRRQTRHAILAALAEHVEMSDLFRRRVMRNPGGDACFCSHGPSTGRFNRVWSRARREANAAADNSVRRRCDRGASRISRFYCLANAGQSPPGTWYFVVRFKSRSKCGSEPPQGSWTVGTRCILN